MGFVEKRKHRRVHNEHLFVRLEDGSDFSSRLYNIFLAAKNAGVKRMVYASSIHAVSGHPKGVQAKTDEPPNPGDLYGIE